MRYVPPEARGHLAPRAGVTSRAVAPGVEALSWQDFVSHELVAGS